MSLPSGLVAIKLETIKNHWYTIFFFPLLLYIMVEATERKADVTTVVARRVDIGDIKVEVARVVSVIWATRPIVGVLAGVVQGTIRIDTPATYKEQRGRAE